ncbi:hypothetical protein [Plantibacter sp. YIM 135347]|uniref:hypothetical protein n=1 Tax=Plantibacter sp. YIM 135347 TaxID=3423919 RepID=UPI003D327032
MAVEWRGSADKHEVPREDALHAMLNHVYWVRSFDEPRLPGHERPDMFIGPSRDRSMLIEVIVEQIPPDRLVIFHVMEARAKMIRCAQEAADD